jgi:hypothetical protein
MEVLHQFLVEPLHPGNSFFDRQLRYRPYFINNLRWQIDVLLRKVLAKIGKPRTNLSQFLLLGRSSIGAFLPFVAWYRRLSS